MTGWAPWSKDVGRICHAVRRATQLKPESGENVRLYGVQVRELLPQFFLGRALYQVRRCSREHCVPSMPLSKVVQSNTPGPPGSSISAAMPSVDW